MAAKFLSEKNLKFLLYEVFEIESLTRFEYYREHNRKTFDMVLKEALKLSRNLLYPVFTEMDRNPPELIAGKVKVHPSVRTIMKEFGDGGWISSRMPYELDGNQLPHLIADACDFIFGSANYSAGVYPGLSAGAAHLIESFGSKELFDTYVPNIYAGRWQGTMALTEPEAGSSLTDITTTAEATDHGYYLIKGQKIFISAGDHDGVENVVHLMLVKIKDAPAGIKGISLFVVPKNRIDENGRLISNDVNTSGIYHKLGYRGCPIVQLSMGDKNNSRGWLVGEPHNGLRYMFQLMNQARIGVGIGAASIATAAYYASLDYAKTRRQGRPVSKKNPALPQVPIIEHADVKRMLLFQRAVVEGSLSLLMQCSKYVDMIKVLPDDEKEKYINLLEILTPVAKSYPSEMGIESISQGLQCFGGSGYCDDYPMEQYYRDARIHPIHEGTTGIQGMDLLGRKVVAQNGRPFILFIAEIEKTIAMANEFPELRIFAQQLNDSRTKLQEVTRHLMQVFMDKGAEFFLADATLYLELFGIVAIAWQWLLQGIAVRKALQNASNKKDIAFYQGKFIALRYFFGYELPKTLGLAERLLNGDGLTVVMTAELFND
ncbi:MAG: acyl-CoA dehydrogenase [Desulfobacteraceae bacterium]|nr:MAG: acyl-CoA dehydrogenase [Desulfobacteraceae bacterium]